MLEIYVTGRCMRDHIGVMIFFVERMATSVSYEFLYGMKKSSNSSDVFVFHVDVGVNFRRFGLKFKQHEIEFALLSCFLPNS